VQDSERALYIHSKKRETPYPDIYTFSTSGGISNYFPMPDYRRCAIEPYFRNHDPGYPTYKYTGPESLGANGGIYANGGRAFPDVAANAAHLAVFVLGDFFPQGETGTSLSAPIFASIITMINQERTNAGKGPVGFINPVMYKHPEVFNDITLGNAPGCHTPGFSAVEGWDPTTGLGE
jgi:tripeptidyl-peptidase-1